MDVRRSLLVLGVLALVSASLVTAGWLVRPGPIAAEETGVAPVDPAAPAIVLAEWDARRAAAWGTGDPSALRALYVEGSGVGKRDRSLLRSYADRGLRVTDLRTQVLAIEVVEQSDALLLLEVTDRLVGGTAQGAGERFALPAGHPVARSVRLVRQDGTWLVDEVSFPARQPERR